MTIREDMTRVLGRLVDRPSDDRAMNQAVVDGLSMSVDRVNDAVRLLKDSGYVRVLRTLGGAPFDFRTVEITPHGRFEWERATDEAENRDRPVEAAEVLPTPQSAGSPFGFTDLDEEFIGTERQSPDLVVVLGYQFESVYYDSRKLIAAIESQFREALGTSIFAGQLTLRVSPLEGGYGEHLFNRIARSIIGADIAVFETSDLNPNVMIEMGVALTWETRVHSIREASAPRPPTDISGQTWAVYHSSGETWEAARPQTRCAGWCRWPRGRSSRACRGG